MNPIVTGKSQPFTAGIKGNRQDRGAMSCIDLPYGFSTSGIDQPGGLIIDQAGIQRLAESVIE